MTLDDFKYVHNRRKFLQDFAGGLGTLGLWQMLRFDGLAGTSTDLRINPLQPRKPHFAPKARNVIFMFIEGGPSQLDLFDPKPEMKKWDGQPLPSSMTEGLKLAFIKPTAQIWASPRVFAQHGQCGMEFSDWLPHLATCADDICMIRSVVTEQFNHSTGQLMMNCGTPLVGRPSMGAWAVYGLGNESQNLPGYVVLGRATAAGTGIWSSGFLPSSYQGVPFRDKGDPVLYLSNPSGIDQESQRARIEAIRGLDEQDFIENGDLEIASRMASYELAFRMQSAAPELMDFSHESPQTLEMYGINKEPTREFGAKCLLARRLVERGVRFVQLISSGWDHHSDLNRNLKSNCQSNDQPTAALLKDLKQRGLLESTLVIWGGEFGRTPMIEDRKPIEQGSVGRDHHPFAFTMWMAGGGIRGGQVVGKTDDLGFRVVQDKVHVHDLHATILHSLGLDHEQLTFRHQGRNFRLTDVGGQVVSKLLL
jgi:uncharacterized protein DUF1501